MDAAEYALRKVIRNNPVVREVDVVRQRELGQWICVGAVLVLVLLFTAWQSAEVRRYGYRIQDLQQERARVEERARTLREASERLRSLNRLEDYATTHLDLIKPGQADAIVIERVIPPERPNSSVVAAAR